MDQIIRSAALSEQPRQLARAGRAAAAKPAPVMAKAANAGVPAPAAAPSAAPVQPAPPGAGALADAAAAAEAAIALARQEMARELVRERDRLRSEADKALAAGRADAERQGYAAGEQKGLAAGRAALQGELVRLRAVLEQLGDTRSTALAQVEESAVEIVFAAVCRIAGTTVASREQVAATVRHLLGQVRSTEGVCVRLHPEDFALLVEGESGQALFGAEVSLAADTGVGLGGCMIDAPQGRLDVRLETQLEKLRDVLLATRAARAASSAMVAGA